MKRFRRGQRGFTLIEIIIVLAILAILAALLVPHLAGFLARGHRAAYDADREVLEAAVLAFHTERPIPPTWPTHGQGEPVGAAAVGAPATGTGAAVGTIIVPRRGLIDIGALVARGYLKDAAALRSARGGPTQHPTATSTWSYIWYVADIHGTVMSMFWDTRVAPPVWRGDGFHGVYP
ncbi:MAG: Type II secretion system protein G [Chloroflexi bacterium]|nr:Type II secretion system protein G [Chloroflexota bacterium]